MLDLSQKYLYEIETRKYLATPISYDTVNDKYTISARGIDNTFVVGENDLIEDTTVSGIDFTKSYYIDADNESGETITHICKIIYYDSSNSLFCISIRGIGITFLVEASELTEVQ